MKKYIYGFLAYMSAVFQLQAQPGTITIDECYDLARKNYPLVMQQDLISQSADYSVENVSRGYWPQLAVYGQATYQSDVIEFPAQLPGRPELTRDQYRFYAELNQTIYQGGMMKQQKELQRASASVDVQRSEVELYRLKERINQLFFGVMLVKSQMEQNRLLRNDLDNGIRKITAAIENGIALPGQKDQLLAEKLKAAQRDIELESTRNAYIKMLSLFIGRELDAETQFNAAPLPGKKDINRPELALYGSIDKMNEVQGRMIKARNSPRLNLFAQGGIGKPAFNIFNDDFDPFYIGGLRLTIPLSGFYTLKNEQSLNTINRKQNELQKSVFLFNTALALEQQNEEENRINRLIETDNDLITLRSRISKTAEAQLEHGTISSTEYLHEVFAEDGARQNKSLHEIQLLMAQYTIKTTTGN